jgi:hypothetical protein
MSAPAEQFEQAIEPARLRPASLTAGRATARPPRRFGAQYAWRGSDPAFWSGFQHRKNKELILPSLQETRTAVILAPAKPAGLADLGAPLDGAVVKKGRVHEYLQHLSDGKIGRRFQDIRVIGVKTVEAGVPSAKIFIQFEVFGDNTAAPANGVGFEAVLFAGSQQLASLASSSLFLPYANFWYPNRFVFDVPMADFDQADRLEFIAKPEEVRAV